MSLTLNQGLDKFDLEQVNANFLGRTQIDEIYHPSSAATSQPEH